VAVRSSATAEDLAEASFAGQQDTFLYVRGAAALHRAVVDCWASLWTARALAYRARQGIAPESVSLAVVVQVMVDADAAGVMFTADPATGRRDRTVVSAAWGLGESVVGGEVGTDDHVVDRSGAVVSRHVADKAVMTVPVAGGSGTEQVPVPADRRRAPVLDDAEVAELARLGARIEAHYGAPQDVEWARSDGRFLVLQARPITALPAPAADPPTTWTVPPGGLYFRASIVEQMPDPLTPLFADLVDRSVTRSLRVLMDRVLGRGIVGDGDIELPTVNGYAYYRYSTRGMARVLVRTPLALLGISGHGPVREGGRYRGGPSGWRDEAHPRYVATVARARTADPAAMTSDDILAAVRDLLDAGTEYYTAVQSVIPVAVTSEYVFGVVYDRLVRRARDPVAHTLLLGFDSEPLRAEKSLWDLAAAARGEPDLAAVLARTTSDVLVDAWRAGDTPPGADPARWGAWCAEFQAHLDRFGHTVYNLDLAEPVPADAPGPLFDSVRFYLAGHGSDPDERRRRTAARREQLTRTMRARLDPVRRVLFDRTLRWAQGAGPVREDALADVGLAWPVMRRMLLELGDRLVAAGVVAERADVFWLHSDELVDAVREGAGSRAAEMSRVAVIEERRMTWRGQRRATPPAMLPETGWIHRLTVPFLPAGDRAQAGDTITGVAVGTGQVTARARVLDGPADFGAMEPGEVLVARITTPAWTSLFAMASAVVTDVGGPLSHSSIVAREYGIPAVLGTGAATSRIRTGQLLRVDGDAGRVTLLPDAGGG
jgi:pyruvate,water dikinase